MGSHAIASIPAVSEKPLAVTDDGLYPVSPAPTLPSATYARRCQLTADHRLYSWLFEPQRTSALCWWYSSSQLSRPPLSLLLRLPCSFQLVSEVVTSAPPLPLM